MSRHNKIKREEEWAQKHEKAHHAKTAFVKDGEEALIKNKLSRLTQD
jgi:hypothetical protein